MKTPEEKLEFQKVIAEFIKTGETPLIGKWGEFEPIHIEDEAEIAFRFRSFFDMEDSMKKLDFRVGLLSG